MAKAIVKKGNTTALAKWDDELAKFAEEVSSKEQMPGGSFLSFKAGQISIAGTPVKGNSLQVIIMDSIFENCLYEGDYDADNPQPPSCYAFGREDADLKPHEEATDPKCEQCAGCPMNDWGSSEKGKGKACKNTRRLAIISANGLSPESVENGELLFARLPVTSVKGWCYYVKSLAATLKRPPFGVVTEISSVPDAKTQFKVTFTPVGPVPNEVVGAIMERRKAVQEQIAFPYPKASEKKPAAKGKKGRKF